MTKKAIYGISLAVGIAAIVLGGASRGVAAPAGGTFASAEEMVALQTQAEWIDLVASRLERRGRSIADADARELRMINAQLTRFDRVMRAASDSEQSGVLRKDAEALQDRIAQLWVSVRSLTEAGDSEAAPVAPPKALRTIPERTNVEVQLATWLSSRNSVVGDRFSALLLDPIVVAGEVVVPAGAVFEGVVSEVDRAGRMSDGGRLHLFIDRLRGDQGQIADVSGLVVGTGTGEDLKGEGVDKRRAAIGAIVGGVLGGIVGGKNGALIGVGVGAGGSLLADKGKDVDVPQGTVLRVELEEPVLLTWTFAAR